MKIKGANLGEKEVAFKNLSDINWTEDIVLQDLIKYLEKMYYSFCNEKDNTTVQDFPIDDNGKAIITSGMVNHRCSCEFDILRNISKYGVLASEWFGILESENEGRFCVFVSKMKNEDYPYKGDLAEDNYSRLNIGKNIILFFDASNPIMQFLLHLDYFEYERMKQDDSSKINTLYDESEIELFDKLIEPLSPFGKDMRKNYNCKINYWSAIPGGIPSFLINGICIKNNQFSNEQIDELSNLFPNATIFRGNLDIVHLPYYKSKDNNKKTR